VIEWVSYVGYAVLHTYVELAFAVGVGVSIVLAACMPFRAQVYWRHSDDDE
jgi:hypothetical protein